MCVCVFVQTGGVKHNTGEWGGGVNIVRAMKRNKGFQKIDLGVGDLHQQVYALNGHPRCSCSAPWTHAHIKHAGGSGGTHTGMNGNDVLPAKREV